MALYQRNNTWWIRFTTASGKRVRQSAQTTDKVKAQELHDTLKAEYWRIEKLGEKPRRTWQEAVVRWLQEKEHKKDIEKDKAKLAWLDSYLGHLTLDQINRDLVDQIGQDKKAESSGPTANRYLALLRSILRAARDDWEWVDKVPRVRLFQEQKKRVRWITQEEAKRLLKALPPHLAAMTAFSLATGLRQSNVSYLRWDQVSLTDGRAWIHPDESKSGRAIAVPLNEDALATLRKQLGKHSEYVFTYRGNPVARTSTKAWKAALAKAGIEDFRWHDLRHTWASWHVQNGTSLQELQELGGWASFDMVLRYAHLAKDHLKSAARRIEGTILAQPENENGLRLLVSR